MRLVPLRVTITARITSKGVGLAEFTSRLAVTADVPALTVLMDAAIAELQRAFLDDAQIASSRAIMGIDTELIDDGTYFVVESDGDIAGCGGWLMSTLSGEPLYTAYGFRPLERLEDSTGGAPVPLIRMEKRVDPSLLD